MAMYALYPETDTVKMDLVNHKPNVEIRLISSHFEVIDNELMMQQVTSLLADDAAGHITTG